MRPEWVLALAQPAEARIVYTPSNIRIPVGKDWILIRQHLLAASD
jgi:hypothetical protein